MNYEFHIEPRMLRACIPAMSKEKSREYLCCVHITERAGRLVYEATNGHFLVRAQSALEQETDCKGLNVMVPDFFAKELAKPAFLKGYGVIGEEYLVAVIEGQTISLEMPKGIASNRLVEGEYPDISAIMPRHRRGTVANDILGLDMGMMSAISASATAFHSFQTEIAIGEGVRAPIYFRQDWEGAVWEAVLMPVRI